MRNLPIRLAPLSLAMVGLLFVSCPPFQPDRSEDILLHASSVTIEGSSGDATAQGSTTLRLAGVSCTAIDRSDFENRSAYRACDPVVMIETFGAVGSYQGLLLLHDLQSSHPLTVTDAVVADDELVFTVVAGLEEGDTPGEVQALEVAESVAGTLVLDASPLRQLLQGGKGLSFSPYLATAPCPSAFGSPVSNDCLTTLLDVVDTHTAWVRTYGSSLGLENIPSLAKSRGLKVAAGAYVAGSDAGTQIQTLMDKVNAGLVDLAIVGNEAQQAGVPQNTLIGYIKKAKSLRGGKGTGVPRDNVSHGRRCLHEPERPGARRLRRYL